MHCVSFPKDAKYCVSTAIKTHYCKLKRYYERSTAICCYLIREIAAGKSPRNDAFISDNPIIGKFRDAMHCVSTIQPQPMQLLIIWDTRAKHFYPIINKFITFNP